MDNITAPRELDELPDGSVVELLDKRGSQRVKREGHWRDPNKAPDTTWNVNTYVNTRRYGARVIERGPQQ
ncbi:hypothetical protein OG824_13430 [Streptomyces prunicolor]|uniref:hypothetical protein n=1 Tax=Streptomyces prunicolor TaxID=67348 RepID=UPI00224F58A9|nr:hypothetical protein [Streptomyces prunicolor]MCX5236204.1 hypothetical protein [Streptomyces prunicolor]